MSILNLNTPQGGNSVGKKKTKIWMGAGLLAAVLGVGSTLAANITINSPEGNTEFGQGVTQTVYCGGTQSVTVSPMSTYVNTVKAADTPAQETLTASVRVLDVKSGSDIRTITVSSASSKRVTIGIKTLTTAPRWGSTVPSDKNTTMNGFWLSSATSTSDSAVTPTPAQLRAGGYFFAQEVGSSSGTYKNVTSNSDTNARDVIVQNYTAAVPGAVTSEASFRVGGVLISNIPPKCVGVNFVVSSFGETGTVQTLVSSGSDIVREVAARWTGSADDTTDPSKDRNKPIPSDLISQSQTGSTLKFIFTPGANGTALTSANLYKLVVETQEDALT